MQDAYYQSSPYNVVRITLNLEKRAESGDRLPGCRRDFPGMDRAEGAGTGFAARDLRLLPGVCRPMESKKLQKGFIALLDLKNSESGIIPHENTLSAPKQDRLQLMRSIEGNEDLIYMLYSDDRLAVNNMLDKSVLRPPS